MVDAASTTPIFPTPSDGGRRHQVNDCIYNSYLAVFLSRTFLLHPPDSHL